MAPQNRIYSIIEQYRRLLKKREKGAYGILRKRGNKSKNRILDFFLANGRWPNRHRDNKQDKVLGTRFNNYVSKQALGYDPALRRIALATGLKSNHKRPHNVAVFKQEILDFVETHGRVPSTHDVDVPGESALRHKLDYYTKICNDMTLLGKVYEIDKCHLSGIPMKYRAILNEQLDIEKPLVRLV